MQLHVRNRIESSAQSRAQRKCPTSSGALPYSQQEAKEYIQCFNMCMKDMICASRSVLHRLKIFQETFNTANLQSL